MQSLWRTRFLILAALAIVLCGATARADDGRLTGVVRDATGAALPGATVTVTNDATGASQSVVSGADGSYSVTVPQGVYSVAVSIRGFSRQSRREVRVGDGATASADFGLEAGREEEVTVTAMQREQTVADVPFSVAAPTEETLRRRGVENIEGVAANVAGFTVQNLGPGTEPGRDARRVRGPDRARPARRQGAGRRLPRRVGHLAVAVHARPRPVRHRRVEVLRGPQGTLFGSGSLSGTVRYITNQPELGRHEALRRARRRAGVSGGSVGGDAQARLQRAARRQGGPARRRRTTTASAGFIDAVQPDLSVNEDVNDGFRTGVRAALRDRSRRAAHHHAAHRLPARRDGRLEPHRRLQHPRQSVHDHAARRHARRPRAVHAAGGGRSPTSSCSAT